MSRGGEKIGETQTVEQRPSDVDAPAAGPFATGVGAATTGPGADEAGRGVEGRGVGHLFAARVAGMPGSPIDRSIALLQRQTHPTVPFAFGAPAPDAIPARQLAEAAALAFGDDDAGALGYGPTEGEASLRAALRADLLAQGLDIADDELLITAGGTQGLDLVCKLFVGPGDTVIAEDPTYSNGIAIVTSYEGHVLRCPTDENGLRVDAIARLVATTGRAPKLIYTIPNFQNPGGSTLARERRRTLLQLAERYDCLILEDDPYGRLFFDRAPPPSLFSLDRASKKRSGRVIGVHTFSKILAPGLRVGWIQAPPPVIAKMIDAKQGLDTCTNVPAQRMIARFLESGAMPGHLERLRRIYRARRDAMEAALKETFADMEDVRWTSPGGGFFIWLELSAAIDADRLLPLALAEGVAFIPGSAFRESEAPRNALRLSFAYPDEAAIVEGVRRLRRAMERMKRG
jgi:2-aminoadipate transaminase